MSVDLWNKCPNHKTTRDNCFASTFPFFPSIFLQKTWLWLCKVHGCETQVEPGALLGFWVRAKPTECPLAQPCGAFLFYMAADLLGRCFCYALSHELHKGIAQASIYFRSVKVKKTELVKLSITCSIDISATEYYHSSQTNAAGCRETNQAHCKWGDKLWHFHLYHQIPSQGFCWSCASCATEDCGLQGHHQLGQSSGNSDSQNRNSPNQLVNLVPGAQTSLEIGSIGS